MAGAPSVRNIIVGAASAYLSLATTTDGTAAAALPTFTASVSARTTLAADVNWKDVGYTTEGVMAMYEPTYGEAMVDQLLDAARLFKTGMKFSVQTSFSEATLENLFIVMNQSGGYSASTDPTTPAVQGATGGVEVRGGALGDYPVERSLTFVGPGPRPVSGSSERIYYLARAMSIESSQHGLKREDVTVFPVTFRCLPLASTSNAYGKIVDRGF
jgi:hypothetical protein